MLVVYERWVGDGDRLLHIDTKFFWPLQHFLRILAGLLNRGSLRAQSPPSATGSQFSILSLTVSNCNRNSKWPKPSVAPGYIIVSHPLIPVGVFICHHRQIQPRPQVMVIFRYLRLDAPVSLVYRLFTQVHLLIDGSVEGQYVTLYVNSGCTLEDQLGAIDDKDRERERVSKENQCCRCGLQLLLMMMMSYCWDILIG